MKKIDFRKLGLIFEIGSFATFTISLIIYIIKFLRSEGIVEITSITMNNMIKISIVCFVVLCIVFLAAIIFRVVLIKLNVDDEINDTKIILSRTVIACLIFIFILCGVFYYLCIYNTNYSVTEFLKSL